MRAKASYVIKNVAELNEREKSLDKHTRKIGRAMFELMMNESERMGYKNAGDVISIVTNSAMMIIINTATSFPEQVGREIIAGMRNGLDAMLDKLESSDFDPGEEGEYKH